MSHLHAFFCCKCRIYALFCRECCDSALFGVECCAEFLAEILRNTQNFGRKSTENIGWWSLWSKGQKLFLHFPRIKLKASMSWNSELLIALRSSHRLTKRDSGICRISAEMAEFWKTRVATFPVLLFPPWIGSGKKHLTPILSWNWAWNLLFRTSLASQAVALVPFILATRFGWRVQCTPLRYLFLGSTRYYTIFWVLIR